MGRRWRRRWGPLGWLAALLGASILTPGFPPTQGQTGPGEIPITQEPSVLFVGGRLTLTPGGNPNPGFCVWYRRNNIQSNWILMYFPPPNEMQYPGPIYTGREVILQKCSLRIRNLTLRDSGRYTVIKEGKNFEAETGRVDIKVKAPPVVKKWPKAAIVVGAVVGAVAGAVLIGVLLYYSFRRYSQRMAQRVSKSSLSVPEEGPTV